MLGGISSAPWVPTRRRDVVAVADAVFVPEGSVVYDLGAGDGTVLFILAERYPNASYIGYEIAFLPWMVGLFRKMIGGKKFTNVSLRFGDLFGKNIGDADIVFVFLLRKAYPKLLLKLKKELKPETKVLIEAWPLPGSTPSYAIREDSAMLPVYVYVGSAIGSRTEADDDSGT